MTDWTGIALQIEAASGDAFAPGAPRSVGGGCINRAVELSDGKRSWFVKVNRADQLEMFEAEYAGLAELSGTATIRVPRPLCTGCVAGESFIALEHLSLGAAGREGHAVAGRQLAALHRTTAPAFGWHRDNTIGATPQPNGWSEDWIAFWSERRLGFQLELAARRGYGRRLQRLGERLLASFASLIDHEPAPSLIHGDLWGGNLGFTRDGAPVLYDPATYYADREAEIAMTELFGGFGADFYAAYNEAWPLDPGYATRKTLYNLYHILNHLNLFGSGYAGQAEAMMERLLAEL